MQYNPTTITPGSSAFQSKPFPSYWPMALTISFTISHHLIIFFLHQLQNIQSHNIWSNQCVSGMTQKAVFWGFWVKSVCQWSDSESSILRINSYLRQIKTNPVSLRQILVNQDQIFKSHWSVSAKSKQRQRQTFCPGSLSTLQTSTQLICFPMTTDGTLHFTNHFHKWILFNPHNYPVI